MKFSASEWASCRGKVTLNDCEKALIDIKQVLIVEPQDSDAQEKLESCLLAIIEK